MLTSHEMMVLGKAYQLHQLLLGQYLLNKKREKRTKKRRMLKFHFCHLPCQEEEMKLEVIVSRICKRWESKAAAAQNSKQAVWWMLGSCRHKTALASPLQSPASRQWCSRGDVCVMASSQGPCWNQDGLWYGSFAVLSLQGQSSKHRVSNAVFAQKFTVVN